MSKQITPLIGDRAKGESKKAVHGCNDYLTMGAGRSLTKLHKIYTSPPPEQHQKPPTKSLDTLKTWSNSFGWVERSEQYDIEMEELRQQFVEEGMREGLALDAERVAQLKQLYDMLFEELTAKDKDGNQHRLWLPDVKSIGSGEFAERVDIERYNSSLVNNIRDILDDLAKETGGRIKRTDVTGELNINQEKGYAEISPDDWDEEEEEENGKT